MAETTTAKPRLTPRTGGQPARRRFRASEYYRMAEAGILRPGERVELIEGAIIEMSPIGSPHALSVDLFTNAFAPRLAGWAAVRVQNPVRLDDGSEPEPDLALLRLPLTHYA